MWSVKVSAHRSLRVVHMRISCPTKWAVVEACVVSLVHVRTTSFAFVRCGQCAHAHTLNPACAYAEAEHFGTCEKEYTIDSPISNSLYWPEVNLLRCRRGSSYIYLLAQLAERLPLIGESWIEPRRRVISDKSYYFFNAGHTAYRESNPGRARENRSPDH